MQGKECQRSPRSGGHRWLPVTLCGHRFSRTRRHSQGDNSSLLSVNCVPGAVLETFFPSAIGWLVLVQWSRNPFH